MPYKTPGVYFEEKSSSKPSVAEVETAIPTFIGYTEKATDSDQDLTGIPKRICSLVDYETLFGGPAQPKSLTVELDANNIPFNVSVTNNYQLYYALQLFYANGGGICYIVSAGPYASNGTKAKSDLKDALDALRNCDEPTLLVIPDAVLIGGQDLFDLQRHTLKQCARLRDRFAVLDLKESDNHDSDISLFRQNIGTSNLKYGAAYTPHLHTSIHPHFIYQDIALKQGGRSVTLGEATRAAGLNETPIFTVEKAIDIGEPQESINARVENLKMTNEIYRNIEEAVKKSGVTLPPSSAIAGIYTMNDHSRGVWRAAANIGLNAVTATTSEITNADQESLNIDVTGGKSINAIRTFASRGVLVWGARTLAGNDNEWCYIQVHRFFIMVEESLRRSTEWAVFEPNTSQLWIKIKMMIENYLIQKWRQGALKGAKPITAFYVRVGLGETMTAQDVAENRLIIEIGMAVVRPAEFIPLRFSRMMSLS
ncbi:MAG: phage tail sheath family protein [Gammaproteobacteria bacterium]|nr:phage tail sheath family protein [Gammaproteobacteria bacterium]